MSRPRIIGGTARGKTLETPKSGTRPSPSRLREALFNILEFRGRGSFLDLFSGSGAVGLEAASRGWRSTCVDASRAAADVITRNARSADLTVDVIRGDAFRFAERNAGRFDFVFAAPPYPMDLQDVFARILAARPAAPGGLYVFQHPTNERLEFRIDGRTRTADVRAYGSNALSLIDAAAPDASDGAATHHDETDAGGPHGT